MRAREAQLRSLEWIRDIRLAQRERAQADAALAVAALQVADDKMRLASDRNDAAIDAWLDVTGVGESFDHQLALIWAHEIHGAKQQLADMKLTQKECAVGVENARMGWQRAQTISERAEAEAMHSRRRWDAWRDEQRVNDLAEIRTVRAVSS